jgi:hypothetical protein
MCLLHTEYTHLLIFKHILLDKLYMQPNFRVIPYLLHTQYIQLLLPLRMYLLHMQHMLGRLFYNHLRN